MTIRPGVFAFALLLATTALVSIDATSYARVATPALSDPFAAGIPLNAPEFMAKGYSPTLTQAVAQAKAFTYIVAPTVNMYKSYLAQMRAANPRVKVLYYVNGTFAFQQELSSIPSSWYQLDSAGRKIVSKGFSNYLMNPTNAAWISNREQKCANGLASSGYDGCFLDTMGPAPVTPGYVSSMPYNAATKTNWTPAQWLAQTSKNGAAVKTYVGASKLVFVNGLQNGISYFDSAAPTGQILSGVDGGLVELFVRPPGACITCYHKASDWQKDVDMLVDLSKKGKTVLTVTKVWVAGSATQFASWDQYAMATFLLGYGGSEYFHFRTDTLPSAFNPMWSVDLGAPSANYYATGGYFRRDFANGIVLANPNTGSFAINLGATYRLLNGTLATTVTLAPNTGLVLIKV
jgi:Hypothetical glycosyl hydrolase family 15